MEVSNLTKNSRMPTYMIYPRFLAEMEELPDTAKIVYMHLLDRARLSMQREGWIDEQGNVFLNYTIENLSRALHKSQTTVKTSLKALEQAGLITRKRQGTCRPSRIYVKLPKSEICPNDRRKSGCYGDRNLSASKTYAVYKNYQYEDGDSL